jgi:hypothetical protein
LQTFVRFYLHFDSPCIVFADLLQTKRLLGGLILLLPSKLDNPEDVDADESSKIAEIEQLLIHSNVPVNIFALKLFIASIGPFLMNEFSGGEAYSTLIFL